ncbi:nicotinate phosphoribosyltransferase [Pseudomonas sp. MMS21-TM103]|uniref:nicotinate phosphoribosyltransferase n=1 Tax=Pseudomonas sp. MMS21 TM103 TaxID=2886506 RepID=UPI001EDD0B11|nr:nicotinate phosphoribosyltransferase [Pseudomonas sp. MMS21 TM103]MCG4455925.1 nicotinate phosphoribosyltransferase [Pseudomonas sp. MMS21 TM103]
MSLELPRLASPGALLTDLYQLTMLQAYYERDMLETAVFEFFARKLPARRNFYLAAGLEQVLDYLEHLRFSQAELDWLSGQGTFKPAFLDYLAQLRFSGDVHAMAEGTAFFADEPILRITAPLPQAQLVETRLINLLHFQSLIASKAARLVLAAQGKRLVDFGLRRSHGAEAGVYAARASYLAGFDASATVLAGAQFGIPLAGTMAHSFIQAHSDEESAFEHFAHSLPGTVVLLIDTYDTEAGAQKVVELAPRLAAAGIHIQGVRLDSGDLGEHARKVRAILDRGGLNAVTIFASGNVDEHLIQRLRQEGAPIDGYGVGTHLGTSSDVPALDCAYKLQEYAGTPRRKRSEGKATWPGRKQVYRRYDDEGHCCGDTLTLEGDAAEGVPLIQPVMRQGRRLQPSPPLAQVRACTRQELERLPLALRCLEPAEDYPVEVAPALRALADSADRLSGMP